MTETAKFTPGPWEIVRIPKRRSSNLYRIQQKKPRYPGSNAASDSRLLIAELHTHRFGSADNVPGDGMNDLVNSDTEGCQSANARLIAAAPDLLEALDWAAKSCHHPACPIATGKDQRTITRDGCECHVKAASEAIAKATT